jgi:hypothetical protein
VVRLRTDLGLVAVAALVAFLCSAALPANLALLRAPLALPLVLVLPGYAIVAAVFRPSELRPAEMVVLSVALSIATTIFAAILLDAGGVRLKTAPWMGLLALVTLVAAARGSMSGHARALHRPRVRLLRPELLALAGALVLLTGAAALGFTPLGAPKATQGATALWILPAPDGRAAACVGVLSDQTRVTRYTVQLTVAGRPAQRFGPVTLAPGGRWTRVVGVGLGKPVVAAVLRNAAKPSAVVANVALRVWSVPAKSC